MGWQKVTPINFRSARHGGCCTLSICAKSKEDGVNKKAGHNSNLTISPKAMDDQRLKLGDKFVWLIDADRKAIAIQHDGSGNCSIGYDNKNTRKRFRMHVPKDVAEFLRKEWGVGHDDRTHSFHVQMILSSGVIEIRRTTNDAT